MPSDSSHSSTLDAGSSKKKGKSNMQAVTALVVLGLLLLLFVIDAQRRAAQKKLKELTMQMEQVDGGNTEENKAEAQKILTQLRKIYQLPADIEPTVATIVNVEELRKVNAFYDKAKNGDNLIVTPDRAILFDAQKNEIIDVVPVQIQAPQAQGAQASTAASVQP